jgi:hypothetical protein
VPATDTVALIGYAKFFSRSLDAVIRVYDEAGNVIETHEHTGDFKKWWVYFVVARRASIGAISFGAREATIFSKRESPRSGSQ